MTGWRRRVIVITIFVGIHQGLLYLLMLPFSTGASMRDWQLAIVMTIIFPLGWYMAVVPHPYPAWALNLRYDYVYAANSILWVLVLYGIWSLIQALWRRRRGT